MAMREEIRNVFKDLDKLEQGLVGPDELCRFMVTVAGFSPEEADEVYAALDRRKDGRVYYDEFVNWIMASSPGDDPNEPTPSHKARIEREQAAQNEREAKQRKAEEDERERRRKAEEEVAQRQAEIQAAAEAALRQEQEKERRAREAEEAAKAAELAAMEAKKEEDRRRRQEEDAERIRQEDEEMAEVEEEMRGYLPDVTEVVKPGVWSGFSDADYARMQLAFNRFKEVGSTDMNKDDLPSILGMLGFMYTEGHAAGDIAKEISEYGSVDVDEFMEFAARFKAYEQEKFKEVFDNFDEDGGGQLDTDELMKLMSSMGFTPLRKMLAEALAVVDEDGSGTINFEEFVHLLGIYRYSEGFTRHETKLLFKCFLECSDEPDTGPKVVPPDMVTDLLLQYFGPQSAQICLQLGSEAAKNRSKSADQAAELAGMKAPDPPGMTFQELLILARRCREKEFAEWKAAFNRMDEDGSGELDRNEIQQVIKECGYTLTLKEVEEVCAEVEAAADEDGVSDGQMDFDEFVYLMQVFKERDGFSLEEVDDLRALFKRFDKDGGGEIETLEVSEMLRFQGLTAGIDEVQRLLGQADPNDSGSLDWREYLRFMRLFTESMLKQYVDVYQKYEDKEQGCLMQDAIGNAFEELGFAVPRDPETNR
eukprot:TRINITY_DN8210_c0_g1_i1.p1 TRINITY_DN8210_c0_g1~~TRINITY_DN8210_c0_g1_i1.p1  ORF type:complete len:681 (-),score=248.36 TRINITY_DN8210_c0_g1_i1:90-2039(-)